MILANHLRQTLLEPLKERQREEGVVEGIEIGLEEGDARTDARWRAWNVRREKAASNGDPFDEPPPDLGG